jgi:hypothetical protein
MTVFLGAKLFGGRVTFVVAGSGHIAGVINPPRQVKYSHWVDAPSRCPLCAISRHHDAFCCPRRRERATASARIELLGRLCLAA